MTRIYALLAAGMLIALMLGTYIVSNLRTDRDQFASCRASNIAGGPGLIGGPFELVNSAGETVTETDVITKPTLIYFGYTFCPDVCPLDAQRNAEALDVIRDQGRDAQAVFISIDPERDTPEVVGEYASYMHEDMIGLTGSLEQVKAASKAYRTYYKKQPAEDEFYLVDHSTLTYLVLPEAGFVEFFKREDTAEKIANSAACFIDRA